MSIPLEKVESWTETAPDFYRLAEEYLRARPIRIHQGRDEYSELCAEDVERRVIPLGTRLQRRCEPQERVMLLLPRVDDFVVGLLACFQANLVAVPTVVDVGAPSEAKAEAIAAVLADSGASCLLVDARTRDWLERSPAIGAALGTAEFMTVQAPEEHGRDRAPAREPARDDLAMIMYTSGSTSQPKGVMLNHRTLLFQAALASGLWEIGADSTVVSWLPITHNFGLPLGVLTPLVTGATTVLLTPGLFIQHPGHWLELLDHYGGTHTGATNSALEYCVNSVASDSLPEISLSSVISVFCAGEPLREQTVGAFAEAYAELGLRPDAVRPHYGLTEVGCLATESSAASPTVLHVDVESLGQNRVEVATEGLGSRPLVRNGRIRGPVLVEIVDPESHEPCPPGRVGEVWFSSTATCQGYYRRPEENVRTFGAALGGTGEGDFFRTGDLGFVHDEHLYLVGRDKELLIVNGMKFHPPDLETTLRRQIPEFTLNTAVFPIEGDAGDLVVLVQELPEEPDAARLRDLMNRARAVVSDYYGIALHDIVFTTADAIPRSGIGKVKRNACRDRYRADELPAVFRLLDRGGRTADEPAPSGDERGVRRKLVHEVLAPVLGLDPAQVLEADSFGELGCTSVQYIQLAKRIEEIFERRCTPALLFKYNRVAVLSAHLAESPVHSVTRINRPADAGTAAPPDTAVAVIGMSCRFPGGATTPETFWDNLASGKDGVTRIRDTRAWIVADYLRHFGDSGDLPEHAGLVDGVAEFDAAFFNIAPLEAQAMDPQQRRLMELTWHLFEDGGYRPADLRGGRIGVYVGAHANDYAELMFGRPELTDVYGAYLDSGTHPALLANRISRWYDLHGPSRVINTACSSSLVALNAAVTDLRAGACTEAVVAGVNTLLSARSFACNSRAGMQAADGRCKTFDDRADGYVRAEGYGAVLLKPLAAAVRDGDRIHGVIRGAAVNHDGQTDSLRAPSSAAQTALVTAAYADAGVDPSTVGYVEAHGTGTALGDPIEVQGLVDAFLEMEPETVAAQCALGSVKTNIGHLESAAGIAGLIKVLLCMRHAWLPGLMHFEKLNQFIELEGTPFRLADQSEPWHRRRDEKAGVLPLRAGLSSFGFGGANAHVILEEYRGAADPVGGEPAAEPCSTHPILLSARDEEGLRARARQLVDHLEVNEPGLAALALTLRAGREHLRKRLAFEAGSLDEVRVQLRRYLDGEYAGNGVFTGDTKKSREIAELFDDDRELRRSVEAWRLAGQREKVLDLWVKGVDVEWGETPGQLRRADFVTLPPYPFAKQRHWFDAARHGAAEPAPGRVLHPLVHENVSDLTEQRYRTGWTGRERFLRSYFPGGPPHLPSAAWLETARAALALAHGKDARHAGVRLWNLRWEAPYVHGPSAAPVDISLMPDAEGGVDFDCYARVPDTPDQVTLFCQGQAALTAPEKGTEPRTLPPRVLIEGAERWWPDDRGGFRGGAAPQDGPDPRVLTALWRRGSDTWVAQMSLPEDLRPSAEEFAVHPTLLTTALQAAATWALPEHGPTGTVPVLAEVGEARFLTACDGDATVVFGPHRGAGQRDGSTPLDLDIYGTDERPLLRLTAVRFEFQARPTRGHGEGAT